MSARLRPDVAPELEEIWRKVKVNHAKLRACEGPHDFEPDPADTRHSAAMKDQRCKKCGGVMEIIHATIYMDGVEHGRNSMVPKVLSSV